MALGNHGFVFISRFILHKKTEYEKTNGIFILLIQVIAWGQNSNAFPLSSSGSHDLFIRFENEIINTKVSNYVSHGNLKN